MSHDNELVFQVCRIKERTACFRDGSLQYCSPNDTIQRSTDNSKELSFHNKMNVYAFKNLLINLATTNLQYLCTNDSNDGKLEPCSENSLTLACFGVETGSIKACDDFVKDELVMPLCIKVSMYYHIILDNIVKGLSFISNNQRFQYIYKCLSDFCTS